MPSSEDPPDFLRGVGVLSAHQLRPGLNDGDFGAEAAIGLRQFEAGIAAADHDQMRRHNVEFERFDMGQGLRGLEAGNVGNGGARSDIDEDLGSRQRAHAPIVQLHFERFRRDEAPVAHDQFGAAFVVVLHMRGDESFDHVPLALANLAHVDLDWAGHHAELSAVAREMGRLGAMDLILAGQACDVGAGAADPFALDNRDPAARSPVVPGRELAAASAAEDQNVIMFGLRHARPPLKSSNSQTPIAPTRRCGAMR